MAAYQSGLNSQTSINKRSLFIKHWMENPSGGRKPWFTNEEMDYSRSNLIALTYAEKSFGILLPGSIPEIYSNNDNQLLRSSFKYYWNLLASTVTGLSGINDLELGMENPRFRSENIKIPHFTVSKENTEQVDLKIPVEYSGYFITAQTAHWISAISDPKSRVAHYNDFDGDYNNYSHSATMLYIKSNKTLTRVEWGCILTMMVPLKAPQSEAYNFDATSPGLMQDFTIPFSCSYITCENLKVMELLESALAKYHDFIVRDKSLFGSTSNTKLTLLDELNVDKTFNMMQDPTA